MYITREINGVLSYFEGDEPKKGEHVNKYGDKWPMWFNRYGPGKPYVDKEGRFEKVKWSDEKATFVPGEFH